MASASHATRTQQVLVSADVGKSVAFPVKGHAKADRLDLDLAVPMGTEPSAAPQRRIAFVLSVFTLRGALRGRGLAEWDPSLHVCARPAPLAQRFASYDTSA